MPADEAHRLLASALEAERDPRRQRDRERYFKDGSRHLGLRVGDARRITDGLRPLWGPLPKDEALSLAEAMMGDGVFEHRVSALHIMRRLGCLGIDDLPRIRGWLEGLVSNWAEADEIANHLLDGLILRHPSAREEMHRWATRESIWLRRSAAVSFVVPMRERSFLEDVLRVSLTLLTDPEPLVQKGYGWALKECSRRHPDEVHAFLMDNRGRMPRTPLRIALEHYEGERRSEAMRR